MVFIKVYAQEEEGFRESAGERSPFTALHNTMGLGDLVTKLLGDLLLEVPRFPKGTLNFSLLEHTADSAIKLRRDDFPTEEEDLILRMCEQLGLWCPSRTPSATHVWSVESNPTEQLSRFPEKRPHAGAYEWIGSQILEPPKWLWDSEDERTILVDPDHVPEYVVVSYTWGRWKSGYRLTPGTQWSLPTVCQTLCDFDLPRLKSIMANIPDTRYFWVDVLCIDQVDAKERQPEISKQGQIFARAKGGLIYLWTIPHGNELAHAICDIGDLVLWALRICSPEKRDTSTCRLKSLDHSYFGANLRNDPWFSSLWTLQEMILFPSCILMARNGDYCTANSQTVTITFLASACSLLSHVTTSRSSVVESWANTRTGGEKKWVEARIKEAEDFNPQCDEWSVWAEKRSSIVSVLTASRTDLLRAASMRVTKGKRGEAVAGALKVARCENIFDDESGMMPGRIPVSLFNKILQSEGRILFYAYHSPGRCDFFLDILPTTSSSCPTIFNLEGYTTIDAEGWSVLRDGSVHIPPGAKMQKFGFSLSTGLIALPALSELKGPKAVAQVEERNFKSHIENAYKAWLKYNEKTDTNLNHPSAIRVKFLPLAIKEKAWDTNYPGDYEEQALGIILASNHDTKTNDSAARWYKCGTYSAKLSKTYHLDHGITIGRVGSNRDDSIEQKLQIENLNTSIDRARRKLIYKQQHLLGFYVDKGL